MKCDLCIYIREVLGWFMVGVTLENRDLEFLEKHHRWSNSQVIGWENDFVLDAPVLAWQHASIILITLSSCSILEPKDS